MRDIWSSLDDYVRPFGLEVAPFKVGWYNKALQDQRFAFDVHPDTLAFIVVSGPSMFEKAGGLCFCALKNRDILVQYWDSPCKAKEGGWQSWLQWLIPIIGLGNNLAK